MTVQNTLSESTPTNFLFPVRPLESDRVLLVPYDHSTHGHLFFEASKSHPSVYDYLPWGPFQSSEEWEAVYNHRIGSDPSSQLYATYAKNGIGNNGTGGEVFTDEHGNVFAGIIGYLHTDKDHGVSEVGFVVTLPAFQRSHVTTHAVGLLELYALDPPSRGGLGLRRLQWQAHADNARSVKAAERMGFRFEGIMRWARVLPVGKGGHEPVLSGLDAQTKSGSDGSDASEPPKASELIGKTNPGRHSALLAICWDDWANKEIGGGGGRKTVVDLMARR